MQTLLLRDWGDGEGGEAASSWSHYPIPGCFLTDIYKRQHEAVGQYMRYLCFSYFSHILNL